MSVLQDEKFLEMDDGDGFTTMRVYLIPLNYILQNGWNAKFYIMRVLPQLGAVGGGKAPGARFKEVLSPI